MTAPLAPNATAVPPKKPAFAPPKLSGTELLVRAAITAVLAAGYYWIRGPLWRGLDSLAERFFGGPLDPSTANVIGVLVMLAALIVVWRKVVIGDPRFHAPLLATTILLVGDAAFNILETQPVPPWLESATGGLVREYSPSIFAVITAIVAEALVGRFFWGKWPHLASGYVSGISVAILIKSNVLWPFIVCALITILSKYVLRVANRHLWNPSNFGVAMMLFLAPMYVASLTVQAGNNGWSVAAVWLMGGLIMYKLGRFHIPAAFVLTWAPLAFVRAAFTGDSWLTEIAPITSPMFQLYILFMITDPKTTTKYRWSQTLVAMLVAVVETALRLFFKDVHSLYHALFIVAPITNLAEIYLLRAKTKPSMSDSPPKPASPVLPVTSPTA
jgi:Na+-translocating ferredoxin:NAD+ oxidoreductase RnfD subunit